MKLSKLRQSLDSTPSVFSPDDVDVKIQVHDPVTGKPIYLDDFRISASFGPGYREIIFIPRRDDE